MKRTVLFDFDPVNGAGGNGHAAAHDGLVGIDAGARAIDGHLVVLQDALVIIRRYIIAIDDIVVIALGGNAEGDVFTVNKPRRGDFQSPAGAPRAPLRIRSYMVARFNRMMHTVNIPRRGDFQSPAGAGRAPLRIRSYMVLNP